MNTLAVDAGTTAVKAAVVDEAGKVCRVSRVMVDRGPDPGIDPEHFWNAVARAIAEARGPSTPIDAVTVTGQGDGLWALADDGTPAGNALEWNSTLAGEIIAEWERNGTIAAHYARSGTVLWSGTTAALWLWAKENHPQIAADTRHVFYAKDWINYRLCGAVATDITDATIPFLDVFGGQYDPEGFSFLGCHDLSDAMAPIAPSGTEIGAVTAEAAAITGLPSGTPVLMGSIDVLSMTQGVGVSAPGQAVAVLGTTAAAMAINDDLDTSGEPVGATLRIHGTEQRFLRVMGASSGTSTLDWFLAEFYESAASAHGSFWADVQASAHGSFWADVRASAHGVVMLPYLAGERAPFLAPQATGAFLGITGRTSRADMAGSVALGITFSLRHCLEHAAGGVPDTVVLTGGGASSEAWCQIAADVLGCDVVVDDRPDVACAGVAAIATGRAIAPPPQRPTFAPRRDYSTDYREFVEVGNAIRPIWEKMSRQ